MKLSILIILAVVTVVFGSPQLKNRHTRIVGGRDTEIEEVPWQVAIYFFSTYFLCGGTIVTEKYVVTAAACTHTLIPSDIQVKAGSNLRKVDAGILLPVKEIYDYPGHYYNTPIYDIDISVLEVETPFEFSDKIKPAKLPTAPAADKEMGIVSGWGYTSINGYQSDILQSVEVPIVNLRECKILYKYDAVIADNMLCAGYVDIGKKDSCEYDTGGPLAINGTLIGVITKGFDCAHPDYPGIYTDVYKLKRFINGIVTK